MSSTEEFRTKRLSGHELNSLIYVIFECVCGWRRPADSLIAAVMLDLGPEPTVAETIGLVLSRGSAFDGNVAESGAFFDVIDKAHEVAAEFLEQPENLRACIGNPAESIGQSDADSEASPLPDVDPS